MIKYKNKEEKDNTMKRLLAILLAAMMVFSLTGCGMKDLLSGLGEGSPAGVKNTKNPALIGTWELVVTEETPTDEGTEATGDASENSNAGDANDAEATLSDIDFGMGIEFTEDGKLRYGFDTESLESITSGANMDDILSGMEMLVTIYYEVKSDTELELTVSALMGMKKESQTVEYSLDGGTLVFDGTTYTRVK